MLDAFHSNWTAPFLALKKESKYYIDDFEILTTILSALEWQKHNGNIKMVTDEMGAEYYKKIGIESIWNKGIDVFLDDINIEEINPSIFWAAGKINALKKQHSPCIMIDTDFIVWKSVYDILINTELAAIHTEELNDIYPGIETFNMKEGYVFDDKLDWQVKPFNTAFVYINNEEFLRYYTSTSIKFMNNLTCSDDRLINMVFAEQRLFSMCAAGLDLKPMEIITLEELSKNSQEYFTHIWGLKDRMRREYSLRRKFCIRCIKRILKDFPQYEENLANIDVLKVYYNAVKSDIIDV